MNDMDFLPAVKPREAIELAAVVRGNRYDQFGSPYFLWKMNEHRPIEFIGTMDCKTVGYARELACQHRHFSRIGGKMSVKMVDPALFQIRQDPARFGQVDEMPHEGPIGMTHHPHCQKQGLQKAARLENERANHCNYKSRCSAFERKKCIAALLNITEIHELAVPAPHRQAQHLPAAPLQSMNFSPN